MDDRYPRPASELWSRWGEANLRHVLRIAKPNAAERIALEVDVVAVEVRQAVASARTSGRYAGRCRCQSGSSSRPWTR